MKITLSISCKNSQYEFESMQTAEFSQVWTHRGAPLFGSEACQKNISAPVVMKEIVHGEFGLCYQFNFTNSVGKITMSGEWRDQNNTMVKAKKCRFA